MKILFKIYLTILSIIFLTLSAQAFEENGKGTVDLANYTSFEEDKNQITKDAKILACKNALQKYVSTFTIDKKKNYEKIKSKVNDNYSQYMVCDSIIDENLDIGENKFTIVMKATIDENKIDQALVEVSAIANATADEVSDIVILMFSAKTKSIKQKDDKVTNVDQTKKSVDIEQTEASTEGETQISSETTETNVTTTGGNTVSSSEVITYEVTDIYNESIEAGMVEILNTSGFELIDGGDLDLEEQIETMKVDYGEQGKLSKAVQKSIKQNIASEEISFYVQGIFKIGSQEVDSATGMKMVNVSVVSAKMMHKREGKKFWKTVATVAGNQRKGKGTTYDEAINNAIRLCAQSVAKQMVQKLNAKGIK
tara:strand:+ start:1481 stop:2584 length:1104 start_codon:yes stop_codon:yes gene_type:complete